MPWSEWQAGRIKLASWTRTALLESRDGYDELAWPFDPGTFIWDPPPTGSGPNSQYVYARRNVEITTPGLEGPATYIRYAHQSTRPTAWLTDRDWFPILLDSLEEGVDYGIRPNRTEDDDDAYVEYESDTNIFLENLPPLLRSESFTTFGSGGGGSWELAIQFNGHYLAEHGPIGTPRDDAWRLPFGIPISTGFASGTESSTPPVNYSSAIPAIDETVTDLTLSAWVPDLGTLESLEVRFEHGVPTVRYQMPRWRYWIPKRLPLRQRQRDDGLALRGAPSWRDQQSRQASNRWRSYL